MILGFGLYSAIIDGGFNTCEELISSQPLFGDLRGRLSKKKINIFLWELHHESINIVDRLQRRIPYICLSSSWCVMCLSSDERLCHLLAPLLICFCYWSIMLEPFGVHSHCLCLVTYMMFLLPSLWAILSMV